MRRFAFPLFALLLFCLGAWPPVTSLYEISGEEDRARQARGFIHWLYAAARPQPNLAPSSARDSARSLFGMNTFLEQEVLIEVRAESLRLIGDAGFSYVRQQFPWEDIEIDGKGDFEDRRHEPWRDAWAKYDTIVTLAEAEGIDIIARLDNPPAWSRALGDEIGQKAPPDNFDDYGDFVTAVVERYRGRITYFQLWNEPNIYDEWGEQAVDPEAFTELLCTGYRRAKTANPDAVILAPALSPTVELDGRNLNNLVFLDRMYRAGAGDCFDILSAQAYGLWSGASDRRLRPTVINYPYHLFLRDLMVQHGDAAKPIWLSEIGWNAAPEELPAYYGRVTEREQARYAVEGYRRAAREWPWVGVVIYWFFKRAGDDERSHTWYYFRALEPDFTPLPVFGALAEYANSPESRAVEARPALYFTWQRLRPWLILFGGAGLFFWLLRFLWPVVPEHA
jgi:polysaccharide biosynthesis protein PslG